MEGNLTKGPILKMLTKLAVPIMASSFLGTLYNITDMAWIGLLGSRAVAGVGVGGMFTWLSQGLAAMARMGGQFAQIGKVTRRIMVPFLYIAMKSLYWSKGKTLKRIMWCDDDKIKPYFIEAGKNLTYGNLRRQLADSLEDKPFPELSEELQKYTFWEFGSIEEHFKYRNAVMQTYIHGNFPVFEGFNHMQYQIQNPEGFARMLKKLLRQIDYLNWYFERRYLVVPLH